jgi:hypothetical protein
MEREIGKSAIEDFTTPPAARFAKGCGELIFATYRRWRSKKKKVTKR